MKFKKIISVVVAIAMTASVSSTIAFAKGPIHKPDHIKAKVEKLFCHSEKLVFVSFDSEVELNEPTVTITDKDGNELTASIMKTTDKGIYLHVDGIVYGEEYTAVITGVKGESDTEFGTVTYTFTALRPLKSDVLPEKPEWDGSQKVVVKFESAVLWSEPTVTVTDKDGNVLVATIKETKEDSAVIKVEGLIEGNEYTANITGIKKADEVEFGTFTYTFIATCKKPKIHIPHSTWKSASLVKVDFDTTVVWESPTVTVTDANGNALAASIKQIDNKSAYLSIKGMTIGSEYTAVISGIKKDGETEFGSITYTFTAQKSARSNIHIFSATWNSTGIVRIKFDTAVTWNEPTVTITDKDNKTLTASIVKTTENGIYIEVAGMVQGGNYSATITGIKKSGDTDFGTVTYNYTAKNIKIKCTISKLVSSGKTIQITLSSSSKLARPTVTVKDSSGKTLKVSISNTTSKKITLKVSGLKKNKKYSVLLNGIKTTSDLNYGSISGTVKTK